MKNASLLLFKNTIYSTKPEDPKDQFMGPDMLYFHMFNNPDREILEIIKPKINQKFSPIDKIFLRDEILTNLRISIRSFQARTNLSSENRYNLHCMRKIIVDDSYPVSVEFIRKFKRWTAKRRTALMLGRYSIEFGRLHLVYNLQSLKHEPAIPELREIILYDRDHRMVKAAIWALRDIKTIKSIICLNGLLLEKNLPYWKQFHLTDAVVTQGNALALPGLRSIFENNYLYYPTDFAAIWSACTIQETVLNACSNIPTLEALEILELGINHPYEHIERTAFNSIKTWIKMMLDRIESSKDDGLGFVLATLIKRYDFDVFSQSYLKLKKKSTYFNFQ